jgi:hypothetical protein
VSIERKFLKKTARVLGVMACAGALCLSACISPDLEPPGAASTAIPTRPGGPSAAATEGMKPTTGGTATSAPQTTTPSGDASINVPPTMMMVPAQSPQVGAAGAGSATTNGSAAPGGQPGASTAPPASTAGASGAAGAAAESTKDADAGVDPP